MLIIWWSLVTFTRGPGAMRWRGSSRRGRADGDGLPASDIERDDARERARCVRKGASLLRLERAETPLSVHAKPLRREGTGVLRRHPRLPVARPFEVTAGCA